MSTTARIDADAAREAELPDPNTCPRSPIHHNERVFQRRRMADGTWVWIELYPPPLGHVPSPAPADQGGREA